MPTSFESASTTESVGGPLIEPAPKQTDGTIFKNRIDWLPVLITIAAGAVCYGLFFRRGIWLSVVGYSDVGAERVLLGEIPYRDFPYDYTPGLLWLNALLMKCFGAALLPIRVGLLGFKVATLAALYELGRRVLNRWLALVPVLLTLGWLGYKHIFVTHPAQYSILLVLIAGLLLIKFDESGSYGWVVAAGAAAGIVFVFKYNVGVTLVLCGTLALVVHAYMYRRDTPDTRSAIAPKVTRSITAWWAGFIIVVSAMALYLAFNHAFIPMLHHFYHAGSEHVADEAVGGFGPPGSLIPGLIAILAVSAGGSLILRKAHRFFPYYCVLLSAAAGVVMIAPGRMANLRQSAEAAVPIFGPAIFILTGAVIILSVFRRHRTALIDATASRDRSIVLVGFLALGAYLEVYPRADEYHIVRALPPVFLLFVATAARISERRWPSLTRAATPWRSYALYLWAIPVLIVLLAGVNDTWRPQFGPNFQFQDRYPIALDRASGILVSQPQKVMIEQLASIINSNSSRDDIVFSFSHRGGAFNFLCDRRNPTRLLWWENTGIQDVDRQQILASLEAQGPQLVMIQSDLKAKAQAAREVLEKKYHLIGTVEDIDVYSRGGLPTKDIP